jgi:hypothetical protein
LRSWNQFSFHQRNKFPVFLMTSITLSWFWVDSALVVPYFFRFHLQLLSPSSSKVPVNKFKKVDFPVPFYLWLILSPRWKSKLKLSMITWSLNFWNLVKLDNLASHAFHVNFKLYFIFATATLCFSLIS